MSVSNHFIGNFKTDEGKDYNVLFQIDKKEEPKAQQIFNGIMRHITAAPSELPESIQVKKIERGNVTFSLNGNQKEYQISINLEEKELKIHGDGLKKLTLHQLSRPPLNFLTKLSRLFQKHTLYYFPVIGWLVACIHALFQKQLESGFTNLHSRFNPGTPEGFSRLLHTFSSQMSSHIKMLKMEEKDPLIIQAFEAQSRMLEKSCQDGDSIQKALKSKSPFAACRTLASSFAKEISQSFSQAKKRETQAIASYPLSFYRHGKYQPLFVNLLIKNEKLTLQIIHLNPEQKERIHTLQEFSFPQANDLENRLSDLLTLLFHYQIPPNKDSAPLDLKTFQELKKKAELEDLLNQMKQGSSKSSQGVSQKATDGAKSLSFSETLNCLFTLSGGMPEKESPLIKEAKGDWFRLLCKNGQQIYPQMEKELFNFELSSSLDYIQSTLDEMETNPKMSSKEKLVALRQGDYLLKGLEDRCQEVYGSPRLVKKIIESIDQTKKRIDKFQEELQLKEESASTSQFKQLNQKRFIPSSLALSLNEESLKANNSQAAIQPIALKAPPLLETLAKGSPQESLKAFEAYMTLCKELYDRSDYVELEKGLSLLMDKLPTSFGKDSFWDKATPPEKWAKLLTLATHYAWEAHLKLGKTQLQAKQALDLVGMQAILMKLGLKQQEELKIEFLEKLAASKLVDHEKKSVLESFNKGERSSDDHNRIIMCAKAIDMPFEKATLLLWKPDNHQVEKALYSLSVDPYFRYSKDDVTQAKIASCLSFLRENLLPNEYPSFATLHYVYKDTYTSENRILRKQQWVVFFPSDPINLVHPFFSQIQELSCYVKMMEDPFARIIPEFKNQSEKVKWLEEVAEKKLENPSLSMNDLVVEKIKRDVGKKLSEMGHLKLIFNYSATLIGGDQFFGHVLRYDSEGKMLAFGEGKPLLTPDIMNIAAHSGPRTVVLPSCLPGQLLQPEKGQILVDPKKKIPSELLLSRVGRRMLFSQPTLELNLDHDIYKNEIAYPSMQLPPLVSLKLHRLISIIDTRENQNKNFSIESNAHLTTAPSTIWNVLEFIQEYPSYLEKEEVRRLLEQAFTSTNALEKALKEGPEFFSQKLSESLSHLIEDAFTKKKNKTAVFLMSLSNEINRQGKKHLPSMAEFPGYHGPFFEKVKKLQKDLSQSAEDQKYYSLHLLEAYRQKPLESFSETDFSEIIKLQNALLAIEEDTGNLNLQKELLFWVEAYCLPAFYAKDAPFQNKTIQKLAGIGKWIPKDNFTFENEQKRRIDLITGQITEDGKVVSGKEIRVPEKIKSTQEFQHLFKGETFDVIATTAAREGNAVYCYHFTRNGKEFKIELDSSGKSAFYQKLPENGKDQTWHRFILPSEKKQEEQVGYEKLICRFGMWQNQSKPKEYLLIPSPCDQWKKENLIHFSKRKEGVFSPGRLGEKTLYDDSDGFLRELFGFADLSDTLFLIDKQGKMDEVVFLSKNITLKKTKFGWEGTGSLKGHFLIQNPKEIARLRELFGKDFSQYMLPLKIKGKEVNEVLGKDFSQFMIPSTSPSKVKCILFPTKLEERMQEGILKLTSIETDVTLKALEVHLTEEETPATTAAGFLSLAYAAFSSKDYEKALKWLNEAKQSSFVHKEKKEFSSLFQAIMEVKDTGIQAVAFKLKAAAAKISMELGQQEGALSSLNWESRFKQLEENTLLYQSYFNLIKDPKNKNALGKNLKLSSLEEELWLKEQRKSFEFLTTAKELSPTPLPKDFILKSFQDFEKFHQVFLLQMEPVQEKIYRLDAISHYTPSKEILRGFWSYLAEIQDNDIPPNDFRIQKLKLLRLEEYSPEEASLIDAARNLLISVSMMTQNKDLIKQLYLKKIEGELAALASKREEIQKDATKEATEQLEIIAASEKRLKERLERIKNSIKVPLPKPEIFAVKKELVKLAKNESLGPLGWVKLGWNALFKGQALAVPLKEKIASFENHLKEPFEHLAFVFELMLQKENEQKKPQEIDDASLKVTVDSIEKGMEKLSSQEKTYWKSYLEKLKNSKESPTVKHRLFEVLEEFIKARDTSFAFQLRQEIETNKEIEKLEGKKLPKAILDRPAEAADGVDFGSHFTPQIAAKEIAAHFFTSEAGKSKEEQIKELESKEQMLLLQLERTPLKTAMQMHDKKMTIKGVKEAVSKQKEQIKRNPGILKKEQLKDLEHLIIASHSLARKNAKLFKEQILETIKSKELLVPKLQEVLFKTGSFDSQEVMEALLDLYQKDQLTHNLSFELSEENRGKLIKLERLITRYLYEATAQESWLQAKEACDEMKELSLAKDQGETFKIHWRDLSLKLYDKMENADKRGRYLVEDKKQIPFPQTHRFVSPIVGKSLLVAEFRGKMIARKNQIETIVDIVQKPSSLTLLPPGAGKSKVIMPQVAQLLSLAQGKFTALLVTDELIHINKKDMDESTRHLFRQAGHVFLFDRQRPTTSSSLLEEYYRLLQAKHSGGYVISTASSLKALENGILLKGLEIVKVAKTLAASSDKRQEVLSQQEVLSLQKERELLIKIRKIFTDPSTQMIADEVDEIYKINKDYNFALDAPEALDPSLRSCTHALMGLITKKMPLFAEKIASNEQATLSKTEVKRALKELAVCVFRENDPFMVGQEAWSTLKNKVSEEEFAAFVLSEKSEPPKGWNIDLTKPLPEDLKSIAILKHLLSITFPSLLSQKADVGYGKAEDGFTIVPKAEGRDLPNTLFGDQYDIACASYLYYASKPPSFEAFLAFWPVIEDKIEKDTSWKLWASSIQGEHLPKKEQINLLYQKFCAKESLALRFDFLRSLLNDQIKIYTKQIKNNSQDFLQKSLSGASGTVNAYALPNEFDKTHPSLESKEVLGNTLLRISSQNGLQQDLFSFDQPEKLLLSCAANEKCKFVIDQGASIEGKTAYDVVLSLRKVSPNRQYLYVDPKSRQQMMWNPGELNPVLYDPKKHEVNSFTYFAASDTRGCDWKMPPGEGVLVLSPTTTEEQFLQAIWRARQLGSGQTVKLCIHSSYHKALLERLGKKGSVSTLDVMDATFEKTQEKLGMPNYKAAMKEIQKITRDAAFKKLLSHLNISQDSTRNQILKEVQLLETSLPLFAVEKRINFNLEFSKNEKISPLTQLISLCDQEIAKLPKEEEELKARLEEVKKGFLENPSFHLSHLPEKVDSAFLDSSDGALESVEIAQEQQQMEEQQMQQQEQIQQQVQKGRKEKERGWWHDWTKDLRGKELFEALLNKEKGLVYRMSVMSRNPRVVMSEICVSNFNLEVTEFYRGHVLDSVVVIEQNGQSRFILADRNDVDEVFQPNIKALNRDPKNDIKVSIYKIKTNAPSLKSSLMLMQSTKEPAPLQDKDLVALEFSAGQIHYSKDKWKFLEEMIKSFDLKYPPITKIGLMESLCKTWEVGRLQDIPGWKEVPEDCPLKKFLA